MTNKADSRDGNLESKYLGQGRADGGGGFGDGDVGFFEGGDFGVGGAFAAGDDGAGVAHAAAGWGGAAGDEGDDGFLDVLRDERGGGFFVGAADLADHDDRLGCLIFVEEVEELDEVEAFDRVAADADGGGLADAAGGALPDCFIRERAAARDDADGFFALGIARRQVDVAGHDSNLALAG